MEIKKIEEMLKNLGLPVAYWAFDEDEPPTVPYIVYSMPESDAYYADGRKYAASEKVYIELYTDKKDAALEKKIEQLLEENEMNSNRTEAYLDDEKLFVEVFEAEIMKEIN